MQTIVDVSHRVILVTGSTGHLGDAIVRGLGEAGATVILNSRGSERVEAQAASMRAEEMNVCALPFDITDPHSRKESIEIITEEYGHLDGIVNNAYCSPTCDGVDAFAQAYEVAVTSSWALVEEAVPLLKASKAKKRSAASVVNISSIYGLVSPDPGIYTGLTEPNPVFYGPAKAGLIQLTRYLACKHGGDAIRFNAICPGAFPAPVVCENDPVFIERLSKRIPLGRIGKPDEVVGPVAFLLSSASSYITGSVLSCDGGWTTW